MGHMHTEFNFYNNFWNGNGEAGANFDKPEHLTILKHGDTKFVPLPTNFKGSIRRGKDVPSTWAEVQVQANDGASWGDISLQQGYDGPATIHSTDGTNEVAGFTINAFAGAPASAYRNKPTGEKALDTTMGNWNGPANQAAIDHLNNVVGQYNAYILGGSGTKVVRSANRCLGVTFY